MVIKVSFRNKVVTPGVTATSVLTSAECQSWARTLPAMTYIVTLGPRLSLEHLS
jgi:hypothetical protein